MKKEETRQNCGNVSNEETKEYFFNSEGEKTIIRIHYSVPGWKSFLSL
jgi:hypothetical protein